MANKQILLAKRNINLCEINNEYPLLKQRSSIPRHLCTSIQTVKVAVPISMNNLSTRVMTEHPEKDSKKGKDQIEVIELFPEEEEKLYRKTRARFNNIDEGRDNEN